MKLKKKDDGKCKKDDKNKHKEDDYRCQLLVVVVDNKDLVSKLFPGLEIILGTTLFLEVEGEEGYWGFCAGGGTSRAM